MTASTDRWIQAALEISAIRRRRRHAARALAEFRTRVRESQGVVNRALAVKLARSMRKELLGSWDHPLTPAALRSLARREDAYARTPGRPLVMSDGYALCGEEDARAERKHQARLDAILHRNMARVLETSR